MKKKGQQNFSFQNQGLKVAHNLDQFEEGEDVILTLKDELILKNTEEINETEDILENVNLRENFETKFYQNEKKKLKGEYIDEDGDPLDQKKTMLSHYDEVKPDMKGFYLDNTGTYDLTKEKKLQDIKNKLLKNDNQKITSLNMESKIASEYFTPQENQKKNIIMKKKKNVKKKSQKLIDFLEEQAEDDKVDINQGSRNQHKKDDEFFDKIEKKVKKETYQTALNKAKEDRQKQKELKKLIEIDIEEQEQEFEKYLEKQRRATLKNKKTKEQDEEMADKIKVSETLESHEKLNKLSKKDYDSLVKAEATKTGKQMLTTVISSTDFLKNISTENDLKEIDNRINNPTKLNLTSQQVGTASIVNISLPSERILNLSRKQEQDYINRINEIAKNQDEQEVKQKKEETDDMDKFVEDNKYEMEKELEPILETSVGTGLSGALKMLRDKGAFHEKTKVQYVGRDTDKKHDEFTNPLATSEVANISGDHLDIACRNERGEIMTQKEAFRYLCYKFHGKRPSRTKQDKKLRKQQLQEKQARTNIDDAPLLKVLSKHQQQKNKAFIILDSNQRQGKKKR